MISYAKFRTLDITWILLQHLFCGHYASSPSQQMDPKSANGTLGSHMRNRNEHMTPAGCVLALSLREKFNVADKISHIKM